MEIDTLTSDFASTSEDASTSWLDESEGDDDIYDDFILLSYLIDEATDLSEYKHANMPPSFENILAQEQSVARCNRGHTELGVPTNCLDNDSMLLSALPPSPLTLPLSTSE